MASPDEWFNGTLEAFKAGTLPKYKVFDLGLSPELGVKKMPRWQIIMTQAVVRKAVDKHKLPLRLLENLPSALTSPEEVYLSKEQNSFVFRLAVQHENESIAVALERMKHSEFGIIYLLKSIHVRPDYQYALWEESGLLIWGKNKPSSSQDSAPCNWGQQAS
jgi:hypothetical protein